MLFRRWNYSYDDCNILLPASPSQNRTLWNAHVAMTSNDILARADKIKKSIYQFYAFSKQGMQTICPFFTRPRDSMNFSPHEAHRMDP